MICELNLLCNLVDQDFQGLIKHLKLHQRENLISFFCGAIFHWKHILSYPPHGYTFEVALQC